MENVIKKRNSKYRVIPGLSIKNRDLLQRVKQRSIVLDNAGQVYTEDPEIAAAARKGKLENSRDQIETMEKLSRLDKSIKKDLEVLKHENAKAIGRMEAEASRKSQEGSKGGGNDGKA